MTIYAPAFPEHLARCWGIKTAEPIADTRSSHVYRAGLSDGSSAIAKCLKPSGLHELPGMDFLAWRNGAGAVRLLDRHDNSCLLEDAGSLTLREYRLEHGEDAANTVIVDLLEALHSLSAAPPPAALVPLDRHFDALFAAASKPAHPDLADTLRHCAGIADALLPAQTDIRPLHGDLHHDNIIGGTPRGWLAIDPQGLIGDPAYEVANIFGNPEGAFADVIDPARIIALARLFGPIIGCSEDKILRYAIAHAGVSICWSLDDGDPLAQGSNAFERLTFATVATTLLNGMSLRS